MRQADQTKLDALSAGWQTGADLAQDAVLAEILKTLAVILERVDRLERNREAQIELLIATKQRESIPPEALH
jgi:hypothetical protein